MTLPPLDDLPPPPEDDDGARVLDKLHALLVRYVVFPSPEAADAVTLWDAATHGQPAWEHAPRLAVISPEKRCGKSRLLDIVGGTCHEPLITVNATIAAVVRSLSDDPPTLIVDEADTIFGSKKVAEQNEDLRGILNAGHQRDRPMIRWDITARALEKLPTFAMACLASIGDLPDTVMDRAVVIRMRRRAAGEKVSPFRTRRDGPLLEVTRERVAEWVRERLEALEKAEPDMPLEDRAADTWEPLIAIADAAGGTWPKRARDAAKALTKAVDTDTGSDGIRLLADLRTVFGPNLRMPTAEVVARLRGLEEGPWNDVDGRGKAIDATGLSARLKPYGVRPKTIRIGSSTPRGYERSDFADAWSRYLPETAATPETGDVSAGQSVAPHPQQGVQHPTSPVAPVAPHVSPSGPVTSDVAGVAGVSTPLPTPDGWDLEEPPPYPWADHEGDAA
ncbi:Prophage protein phiRv2 [Parafrankia sp. Ea1.12]|uniref:DUF3631 domain-containing protein n=1 Tax=Parafrankia sp. Ea1.12 TaxID=573499 RepID=UPI000DA43D40|nr:DUF3631 domain-containing protein [Parafrankia sp. Ea1.12]SQD96282.1 Prophage protein phiRv2 [Parafrankia sp. Ea1.12]